MTTWKLEAHERQDLLDCFLRYVAVDTQSDDNSPSFPSTEKQKDLARMLVTELQALGCADAGMDPWGYVMATVPANLPAGHPSFGKVPVVGFLAHLDTYHATCGAHVKPQIIRGYEPGDARGRFTLEGEEHPRHERPWEGAAGSQAASAGRSLTIHHHTGSHTNGSAPSATIIVRQP